MRMRHGPLQLAAGELAQRLDHLRRQRHVVPLAFLLCCRGRAGGGNFKSENTLERGGLENCRKPHFPDGTWVAITKPMGAGTPLHAQFSLTKGNSWPKHAKNPMRSICSS